MNETQNEEQLRFPDDIMEEGGNLAGRIEAILFVAGEAVRVEDLSKALDVPIREVEDALIHLRDEYDFNQRGFSLKRYGHQVQLATRALYSQDVVRLLQPVQKQSLSQAAMETLAVVAYRQPVTRAEVEQIRGVKCDYSLQSLMNKGARKHWVARFSTARRTIFWRISTFRRSKSCRRCRKNPRTIRTTRK